MMPLYPSTNVVNQTIINDLPKANGTAGANSYPSRPNTRDVVWDKDENYFYIRTTDSNNSIMSIERYSYVPAPEPKPEDIFASKQSIDELKGEINDVKQSIQQLISMQRTKQYKSKPKHEYSGSANTNGTDVQSVEN